MIKTTCNKLKITKDTKNIDSDNLLTYTFEWYFDENLLVREMMKIDIDKDLNAVESYDTDELIMHKKYCCFEIDLLNMIIEEVEI